MNHRDNFAPPRSRVADVVGFDPGQRARRFALIVLFAVSLQAVLTGHDVAMALRLADAGALPPIEFFAMAFAFGLLAIGAVLTSLRWRGALVVSALAGVFAAGA